MPIYEYQKRPEAVGCDHCREVFTLYQKMKDDAITTCPVCGSAVMKLVSSPGIATPKTTSELKNLGFTKLVKRDTGVYENVTRTGNEARYMEAGKADTMPDFKRKIAD